MPSPTRVDLEGAAIEFFRSLEAELNQPRRFHPDNLAAEVDFNLEESRHRIGVLDEQLIGNDFDLSTHKRAEALLEGLAIELNALQPEQRQLVLQLAARAEREQLLKLIHLLSVPIQEYRATDALFASTEADNAPFAPNPPFPGEGLSLGKVGAAFQLHVKAKKLGASHQNELARALKWFEECVGSERSLTSVTKAELRNFRNDLERLRANLQGSTLSFKDRLTNSPENQIKSVTAKRYWQSVKAFFAWATDEGHLEDNPSATLKIEAKKGEAKRTPEPFSQDELQALFQSPLYAGYLSESRLMQPGNCRKREGHWWAAVLLLYTGLRAGELSQLLPSDFKFEHDVPHLKVRELDDNGAKIKVTKTGSSVRDVPLHPALLTLGLRQFVERRAKLRPKDRTFRDFNLGVHGRTSDGMTKFWGRYLKKFGVWKPGRATHVWRHTFAACLRANDVAEEDIGALLGHSPQSVTGGYGGAFPLARKVKNLERLDYGFDLVEEVGGSFDAKLH